MGGFKVWSLGFLNDGPVVYRVSIYVWSWFGGLGFIQGNIKVKERRLFVVKLLPSSAEWNQRLPDVYIHLK